MTEENKDLAVLGNNSPADIASQILKYGGNIEALKELWELQKEYEANEARKAFHAAMAEFRKQNLIIFKDKKVTYKNKDGGETTYKHADLGEAAEIIGKALAQCGLNAIWQTEQSQNGITVTCTITHEKGYYQSTSLSAPPDTSGGKNTIQAVGSTVYYLERYTLFSLTGVAPKNQDDDGVGSEGPKPEPKKTVTPKDKRLWNGAINAYQRDGNFEKVLESAELSQENQAIIIYTCAKSIYMSDGNFDAIAKHEGITEQVMEKVMEECR